MSEVISVIASNALVKAAVIDVGIQWGLWAVASLLKTEKFYDLAGSSTFFLLAWLTLKWSGTFYTRQVAQTSCVSVWAIRLGTYLFMRIMKDGQDRRFNKVRDKPLMFMVYWTIQAVWIWITLLPSMMLNSKKKDAPLGTRDYTGWALWAAGFFIEALADRQKSVFKSDAENAGKWIQTGLWGLSRHPNYLGEILIWAGLFLPASSVLEGKEFLSVISPMFATFLLTKVSGIPILERQADKKWGHLTAYQDYKRNTAVLIPYIW